MAKKTKPTKDFFIESYMKAVLSDGKPKSVFTFTQKLDLEESDFYTHFGTFKALEAAIFDAFFDNTKKTIEQSKEYQNYAAKEQLLSFYFTFFGNLTANRSYVLEALHGHQNRLESLQVLKGLRSKFLDYTDELNIDVIQIKNKQADELKDRVVNETYWVQMLIILKFWLDDSSADFEKTDIFIEKSVAASFDLMETKPLKSVVDLGKFLFKEKMSVR